MMELLLIIGAIVAFRLIFAAVECDSCLLPLIISSILLIACISGLVIINQQQVQTKETVLYNHGVHTTDNGKWDLYPVGHKIGTTYVYRCDKCGYSWESNTLYH